MYRSFLLLVILCIFLNCSDKKTHLRIAPNTRIVLLGNNLGSRMMNFGYFETELQLRYPEHQLYIRNMCDGGDTPGFRPHSGRQSPWAYEGAERYQTALATPSGSEGHFESPDAWLQRLEPDIIIAFFGYNESFEGPAGLANFKGDLRDFITHSKAQKYNKKETTQLVLVSPIAFEDLTSDQDLPKGTVENSNLAMYTRAMREIAAENQIIFVDAFNASRRWAKEERLTIDGFQLNQKGYQRFCKFLANELCGNASKTETSQYAEVVAAVQEKNFFWHNDYKLPNGVHAFGRRYEPFGSDNYPAEIVKTRQMTAVRDTAIWAAAVGRPYDLEGADKKTLVLPTIETNYNPPNSKIPIGYKYGAEAIKTLSVPPGYKIDLFASEKEFPELANPSQLSFDNEGRLWVACMPTYPHYRPGDPKPNDKLIILEDTDKDGKADNLIVFAENLHLPNGFEFAPEGVYVAQGTNLKLLKDTDGDNKADSIEIILSGFDDHDTHHGISAFCADPSGAIYMAEGTFLHTNVETAYGPVRATGGGFYRYNPVRRHLERTAQLAIPNPWGIAFDQWGQNFFAETSGPDVLWMMPSTLKPRYGIASPKTKNLIEEEHRVRPTSGLEFVSSRHFPEDVQGDLLLCNSIGFLGMKQHQIMENGTGYESRHRLDLVTGSDPNFRPVDMEFAPDGSLYLVDWHNVLIGHMQHNARDPLRDHVHGRIYRITYPSRPLVEPAKVVGAGIATLLENLKLPEYRTRYRSRRELRGRDTTEVLNKLRAWIKGLDEHDSNYENYLMEGLFVSWGMNRIDPGLLKSILQAKDPRVRAAGVRSLRYMWHQVPDHLDLFKQAASDRHGRVRLEAIVAASWLPKEFGLPILEIANTKPTDEWIQPAITFAKAQLSGSFDEDAEDLITAAHLEGEDLIAFRKGKEIYSREGYCITCHQESGTGLAASGFPPLVDTEWVIGSEERLIKLTLNGLLGPITVMGKTYPGQVPMTPFAGMLTDEEIAQVLTYTRNAFGNQASVVKPETVKKIREEIKDQKGFYSPEELLKAHPD